MNQDQFEKLIDIGIKREKEAHEFYRFAESKVNDKAIRSIFHQLAEEELNHKKILEKFRNNPELPARIKAPDVNYFLAEETDLPDLNDKMTPAQALALAMKKEQQAVQFYQKLAENSSDPDVKNICLDIASMELGHKQKLENAYVDIAYVEAF
ncbi:MAG: ferritin family protein [Candidatus Cloacimonetes bacterium]|nr:ferritin family protein [Candidatus Cloacimonadota bacterium]